MSISNYRLPIIAALIIASLGMGTGGCHYQPPAPYLQQEWESVPAGSKVRFYAEGKRLGMKRVKQLTFVQKLPRSYTVGNIRSWAFSVHLQKSPKWAESTSIYIDDRKIGEVTGW